MNHIYQLSIFKQKPHPGHQKSRICRRGAEGKRTKSRGEEGKEKRREERREREGG